MNTLPGAAGDGRASRFAAFFTIAAFPLSLTSPGATVAASLVAVYGLYRWARVEPLHGDLRRVGAITLAGWLMLVIVDFLNGGGTGNLLTVADYLPLIAIAPLAFGIRASGLDPHRLDRVLQATLIVALAYSLFHYLVLAVDRPGGLNLNSIPYAFVVLVWSIMLLSRGLDQGRAGLPSVAIAVLALVPIVLSGSRLVWACAAAAYPLAVILWSIATGRFRILAPFIVGAAVAVVVAASSGLVPHRIAFLWGEISEFLATGTLKAQSFGQRMELVRSGFAAFLDAPLLGHGVSGILPATFAHAREGGPDVSMHAHLHNEYIAHMVAFGVFGIVFVAGYLWLLTRLALNCAVSAYRRGGVAVVAALAIYQLAEINFHMDPISGVMLLFAGLLLAFGRRDGVSEVSR